MGLFRRKREAVEKPCPRCSEPVASEAIECTACGLDLRELYVPAVAAPREGS